MAPSVSVVTGLTVFVSPHEGTPDSGIEEIFSCGNSLRSRRLEVVGTRKNGRGRRRHARGEVAPARKAPENRLPPPLQ